MAAHRYWRIRLRATNGGPNGGIGELQMRASIGGANVATGGTASASSIYNASHSAAKAFDGLTTDTGAGNGWAASALSGGAGLSSAPWLMYDFGAGNAKDIQEIVIFAPGASGIGVTELPTQFDWQYSDDALAWTTQRSVAVDTTTSPWVLSTSKIFDVRPLGLIDIHNGLFLSKRANHPYYPPGRPGQLTYDPNTTAGRNQIEPLQLWHDPVHGGMFKLLGSTTSLGLPVARRVRLYHQADGRLYREQITKSDGIFEFRNIDAGPWKVVGLDDTGAQNGVIFSHVVAVPM